MEVVGDVNRLKDLIRLEFEEKINEARKSVAEEVSGIEVEKQKRLDEIRNRFFEDIDRSRSEVKAATLNEEKLKVKGKYEENREKLVDELFTEVVKELPKKMKEKSTLNFIAKKAPKVYDSCEGHSYFKGKFKRFKVNNDVLGVRFKTENLLIDLSLNGIIEAKKERIRETIIREVWLND